MIDDISKGLTAVTKDWAKAKKAADRQGRMSDADQRRLYRRVEPKDTIKSATYKVLPAAYAKAAGNIGLANARQIMYAARPLVIAELGFCWEQDSYFTQVLLPDFQNERPWSTADWDVVYDQRGHFLEPHTDREIGLGTLAVRDYIQHWSDTPDEDSNLPSFTYKAPTYGPRHRYSGALFLEKEGFHPIIQRAGLAERFDLALMSTKGMSVTAARSLVDALSTAGVTCYVAHDFDKWGLSIFATLASDTRRYSYRRRPRVIDLGLRLGDVEDMQLESEPVDYRGDPRMNLRRNGASQEEIDFLCTGRRVGNRVELNAMTSDQLIDWLTTKLEQNGAHKMVPDEATLVAAYREATMRAGLQQVVDDYIDGFDQTVVEVPEDLTEKVGEALDGSKQSWDQVIAELASGPDADEE